MPPTARIFPGIVEPEHGVMQVAVKAVLPYDPADGPGIDRRRVNHPQAVERRCQKRVAHLAQLKQVFQLLHYVIQTTNQIILI